MLHVTIRPREWYIESENVFYEIKKPIDLALEHSLLSISKWEAKWKKPFLEASKDFTNEQMFDYVKCMTISPKNLTNMDYLALFNQPDTIEEISNYINDSMTATWFAEDKDPKLKEKGSKEIITSEIIYYWMIRLGMNVELFEKWHLNRLMALIRVFDAKESPKKKQSKKELMASRRAINEARKKKYHTRG